MGSALTEIEEKIRTLNVTDKAELVRLLIAELDAPGEFGVEQAWLEEAKKRHLELKEGKIEPVSGELVFKNLRARLKR